MGKLFSVFQVLHVLLGLNYSLGANIPGGTAVECWTEDQEVLSSNTNQG